MTFKKHCLYKFLELVGSFYMAVYELCVLLPIAISVSPESKKKK